MSDEEVLNERQVIEDYLKTFCLEELLDEILNGVITERPKNPYIAIAKACEKKSLPEILDVSIVPYLVGRNLYGVRAILLTNISSFSGVASYPSNAVQLEPDSVRDYTTLNNALQEILTGLDPTNLSKIDDLISAMYVIS